MKRVKTPIYRTSSYSMESEGRLDNTVRYMPAAIKTVILLILVSFIPISFCFFKGKTMFMFFLASFMPILWLYRFIVRLMDGKRPVKKSKWFFRIARCIIYAGIGVFAYWQTGKMDTVSIGYRILYIEWPVLYAMMLFSILRKEED